MQYGSTLFGLLQTSFFGSTFSGMEHSFGDFLPNRHGTCELPSGGDFRLDSTYFWLEFRQISAFGLICLFCLHASRLHVDSPCQFIPF